MRPGQYVNLSSPSKEAELVLVMREKSIVGCCYRTTPEQYPHPRPAGHPEAALLQAMAHVGWLLIGVIQGSPVRWRCCGPQHHHGLFRYPANWVDKVPVPEWHSQQNLWQRLTQAVQWRRKSFLHNQCIHLMARFVQSLFRGGLTSSAFAPVSKFMRAIQLCALRSNEPPGCGHSYYLQRR